MLRPVLSYPVTSTPVNHFNVFLLLVVNFSTPDAMETVNWINHYSNYNHYSSTTSM